MGRTLTPERQKLKNDAIRLRQELGWDNCEISQQLGVNESVIRYWLRNNSSYNHRNNLSFNQVHIMDCVDGMNKLPHEYVDLIFADPPYNIGVSYGNGGNFTDRNEDYNDWCQLWFEAVYRILKPGGSFYLLHYPEVCAGWLPKLKARFKFQRWITWHYPTNIGQSPNNWTRSHRAILFLTKGVAPSYFNGLADPQPYRNPNDKRIIENLKERPGVTPYDSWEYNLVKNVSKDKTEWPNQIPVRLLERIIKVSCPENGIVCDPFMGSGSTAEAATLNGRRWIGFDLSPESKNITENRCGKL